jgi:predicted nucleic acid-binding protein
MTAVIVDTGAIVALLDAREEHHGWITSLAQSLPTPLLTCEPVLAESFFLFRHLPRGREAMLSMLEDGALAVPFSLAREVHSIHRLLSKYGGIPMSLADACLVRMAETVSGGVVLTLDRGFLVYRKHRRQPVPTLMPPERRR